MFAGLFPCKLGTAGKVNSVPSVTKHATGEKHRKMCNCNSAKRRKNGKEVPSAGKTQPVKARGKSEIIRATRGLLNTQPIKSAWETRDKCG